MEARRKRNRLGTPRRVPVHTGRVRDEGRIINPARDGTLRVLRAARDGGVKRVVVTSAFHAVGFGHGHIDRTFTEDDWSVVNGPGVDAYGRSKILAERAAWDFMDLSGGSMELTTMLPVAVMGPVISAQISGANRIIHRMLSGAMPGLPNMYVPIVDVRDVAAAHVSAMTATSAAGRRFLIASGEPAMAMRQIGAILKEHFGDDAQRVPRRTIPDFLVKLMARFNAEFRPVAAELNYVKKVSNDESRRVLGLRPRTATDAIVSSAENMISRSLVEAA